MKHILLIATGGTIASVRTQQGLKPVHHRQPSDGKRACAAAFGG